MIEAQCSQTPTQLVLYVGWEPLRMAGLWTAPGLRFEFRVADIRTLDPGPLLNSSSIQDRILLMLFGIADPKENAIRLLYEIANLPHPERGEALAKLLVISGLRRLHHEVRKEMSSMPLLNDLLDNPFLRDWFEEGHAKGRAEGRDEAHREDAIGYITQILEYRFGHLPAAAHERIRKAPVEKLAKAVPHALTAPTLEEALELAPPDTAK